MILYINGDSHSSGCEAALPYAFISDDYQYKHNNISDSFWGSESRWAPHPENLKVSYGQLLADQLGAELHCHARASGSNDRIIRTTREYLQNHKPDFVLIGWSTLEREEWLHNGEYWQITAGRLGKDWPREVQKKYREWVINIDYDECNYNNHCKIWDFHLELAQKQIPHLFFNCFSDFSQRDVKDWGDHFIFPYDIKFTYWQWLTDRGHESNPSYHFRADAHRKWAEFLLPHLTKML